MHDHNRSRWAPWMPLPAVRSSLESTTSATVDKVLSGGYQGRGP